MSIPSPESSQQTRLRLAAEVRLKEGSAPPTNGWPTGVTALGLLHKLASSPQSADDALKLLHELQVHQVELDLQHEQLELTQRELADDLARYKAFYESAPVAYVCLSPEGEILEGNVAAALLFGAAAGELRGRPIEALLAPESRWALNAVLKQLRAGSAMDACEVRSSPANGAHPLQFIARAAPGGRSFLAVLLDTTGIRRTDPKV